MWVAGAVPACLGMTLATDGKTGYTIVIPARATAVERTAAGELAEHLKLVTGADFPIAENARGHFIRVETAGEEELKALGSDGVVIHARGGDLVLSGGRRGVLYAVETFLEDVVGVRHWTADEATIPHRATLEVPDDLKVRYVPPLVYREAFNWDVMHKHYEQAVRLKLNGHHMGIPAEWGGHYTILGWCHTSWSLIPPGKYFGEHPEWFAMVGGKRQTGSQLCLSNEEMRKELTRNAMEWVRKNPSAGIISISQNDTLGPCQCERCRAIAKEEGSESGAWIRLVNAVAEDVCKEYPEFKVETLAYQYTRRPPKVTRPSGHVLVRLCSIEGDFARPLDSAGNAAFGNDLRGWAAIAPNLFVWNYTTNFGNYLIPHPNYTTIGEDLRFFAGNHVVGVFEQGDAYNQLAGDMLPLRTWVTAHLLWDPSADQRKLTEDFCNGYFGAAGPFMLAYMDLVNAKSRAGKVSLGCFHHSTNYLTAGEWARVDKLFADAATAVAGDAALSKRVRRERLAVELVDLNRWTPGEAKDEETAAEEYQARAEAYVKEAAGLGVTNVSEGQGFASYAPGLVARAERFVPVKLPMKGEAIPAGAYDVEEDRFYLHGVKSGLSKVVDDERAYNGKAAWMPGSHVEWAVQFHVPKEMAGKGPWRCYVVVRATGEGKVGNAAQYGLYDNSRGEIAHGWVGWDELKDGEYHAIPIYVDALRGGEYFWVSPPGGAGTEGVYVDRVYIEKGKTRTK